MNLHTRWHSISIDLSRARSSLPSAAESDPSIQQYQHYLEHNELELACDMLEEYAAHRDVDKEFWAALRDAASKMQLVTRAERYTQRIDR